MLVFPLASLFRGGFLIVYPFIAALVLVALHRSQVKPRTMRGAITVLVVVGVGSLIGAVVGWLTNVEDRHLIAVSSLLFAVLFIVVFPSVVRTALGHRRVNLNTLTAAISAYLIIGLLFTMIFFGLAGASNYEFFRGIERPTAGDFEYFAFITLTTVGYGDLAPVTPLGRGGAVALAIVAQVYLVTTVARVVSMFGHERESSDLPSGHDFRTPDPD